MSALPYTFDAQDADVILRAPLRPGSDEFKDLRAHKAILSIASIFFRDMFSLRGHLTALQRIPRVSMSSRFQSPLRLPKPSSDSSTRLIPLSSTRSASVGRPPPTCGQIYGEDRHRETQETPSPSFVPKGRSYLGLCYCSSRKPQ